jgi:hypothetical protein
MRMSTVGVELLSLHWGCRPSEDDDSGSLCTPVNNVKDDHAAGMGARAETFSLHKTLMKAQ